MPITTFFEIIGYVASLLIAVSLMMSSILKLRIINLIGSFIFTIYGLVIHAYPVAAVNFFIVLIDLYYLIEIFSTREYFRILEIQPDSTYLRYFLDFHEKDIKRFQPEFSFSSTENSAIFFILRNVIPTGLVIGEIRDGSSFHVLLDYAIPGYRDLRTSRFIFRDNSPVLRQKGISTVYSNPGSPAHQKYLERMGFKYTTNAHGEMQYYLDLSG